MSEVAEFLKLGTTGLVMDLIEDKSLPFSDGRYFYYNQMQVILDLKRISKQAKDWLVYFNSASKGCRITRRKATDVQRAYLKEARRYEGRDEITDVILKLWQDTLDKLDQDQSELVGRVDWITKKALIDQYAESHNLNMSDPILRNIDLQYHDTDRKRGLFYALQKQGKVERLVTDEMIEHAVQEPPKDTRANIRVKMLCHPHIIKYVNWDSYECYDNIFPSFVDPFENDPMSVRDFVNSLISGTIKFNPEKYYETVIRVLGKDELASFEEKIMTDIIQRKIIDSSEYNKLLNLHWAPVFCLKKGDRIKVKGPRGDHFRYESECEHGYYANFVKKDSFGTIKQVEDGGKAVIARLDNRELVKFQAGEVRGYKVTKQANMEDILNSPSISNSIKQEIAELADEFILGRQDVLDGRDKIISILMGDASA